MPIACAAGVPAWVALALMVIAACALSALLTREPRPRGGYRGPSEPPPSLATTTAEPVSASVAP